MLGRRKPNPKIVQRCQNEIEEIPQGQVTAIREFFVASKVTFGS